MDEREHGHTVTLRGRDERCLASFVGRVAEAQPSVDDDGARSGSADDGDRVAVYLAARHVIAIRRQVTETNRANSFRLSIGDAARCCVGLQR